MISSQFKTFQVEPGEAGRRLDHFLLHRTKNLSRVQIQRMIEKGFVQVGGKPAKASRKLRAQEEVAVEFLPPKISKVAPEDIPLDIVYEDKDLLVLNKEAKQVVHPAPGNAEGTLVNALLFHCKDLSGIGGEKRPGIIHRLDKGTSGLIVIAKNDFAHQGLSRQFHDREVEKNYLAFVWGIPRRPEGFIDAPLGRSEGDRKKISTKSRHGRAAKTHYRVVKSWKGVSLLELKPLTGRTHQIRVHLTSLGHAVLGDPVYGKGLRQLSILPQAVADWVAARPFQLLHACRLEFQHPRSGKKIRLEAPMRPEMMELQEMLDAI